MKCKVIVIVIERERDEERERSLIGGERERDRKRECACVRKGEKKEELRIGDHNIVLHCARRGAGGTSWTKSFWTAQRGRRRERRRR